MKQALFDSLTWLTRFFLKYLSYILYSQRPRRVNAVNNSILRFSATGLAAKIRNGELSSTQVIEAYANRLAEVNPIVNGITESAVRDALEQARKVDQEMSAIRASPEALSKLATERPFLGVPITIKDHIAMKGYLSTFGLYSRRNIVMDKDADNVASLKRSGFIPLARSNMPEYGMAAETNSHVFGRTSNPYDTMRTSGGSSGGEGALISSGASILGIGSDLAGSNRIPATFCGLFSHKATSGLIHFHPRDGTFPPPIEYKKIRMLAYGPLCRYAEDLWPVVRIISKPEQLKKLIYQSPADVKLHDITYFYIESLDQRGVGEDTFVNSVEKPMAWALQRAIRALGEQGFKVKPFPLAELTGLDKKGDPKPLRHLLETLLSMMVLEHPEDIERAREAGLDHVHSIPEHVWPEAKDRPRSLLFEVLKQILWPWHNYKVKLNTLLGIITMKQAGRDQAKIARQMQYAYELEAKFKQFFESYSNRVAILLPSYPSRAPFHREAFFTQSNFIYPGIFNMLGLPSTICPAGFDRVETLLDYSNTQEGNAVRLREEEERGRLLRALPVSVQIVGPPYADCINIAVATELERLLGGWRSP